MVVPFAIFAADEKGQFTVSRTRHHMVEGFKKLFEGKLEKLDKWGEWVQLLDELDEKVERAFGAKENLHLYEGKIDAVAEIYQRLKSAYLSTR